MELAQPLKTLTPTLDAAVLQVLAGGAIGFTTGDIQRLSGTGSSRGVRLVLERLVAQGVVGARPAGRAIMYSLNREHLAAPYILGLANIRSALWNKLSAELGRGPVRPFYAAAFGSAVRRDHRTDSDIDLFLVSSLEVDQKRWDALVAKVSFHVTRWTGNDARVLHMTESDVKRLIGREPVLQSIAEENVHLVGEPLWLSKLLR